MPSDPGEDFRRAMAKAARLLAMRAHSTEELRGKLIDKGFSRAAAGYAVSECLRLKFVDDRLFGEMYLQELQHRGYGQRRCRLALARKKLAPGLVAELLDAASDSDAERERALLLLERKLKTLSGETDPRKKREKALRFMVSRGFAVGLVLALYRNLSGEHGG